MSVTGERVMPNADGAKFGRSDDEKEQEEKVGQQVDDEKDSSDDQSSNGGKAKSGDGKEKKEKKQKKQKKSSEKTSKPSADNEDESTSSRQMYSVTGVDITSRKRRSKALTDFYLLQDKSIQTNYLEWAKHEVRYTELSDREATSKLQQANDAYTMSMLMNCLSPLQDGVGVTTLLRAMVQYNVIKMMNPDMNMDMSRMFQNLKNTMGPMYDEMKAQHPLLAKPLAPVVSNLDKVCSSFSVGNEVAAIGQSMRRDNIDEMVMTPKQVAALKVNFMEQYYVDMRSGAAPRKELAQAYDRAIGHLASIANNSGFDMAVVAAEERHIVGLKAISNPTYMSMFEETHDIYGVKPVVNDGHMWQDAFMTADEHSYTVGGDVSDGAFTVRVPMEGSFLDSKSKDASATKNVSYIKKADGSFALDENGDRIVIPKFDVQLEEKGAHFACMERWVESDDCQLSESDKNAVLKRLSIAMGEYKASVVHMLVDDGLKTASEAEKYWNDNFEAGYSDEKSGRSGSVRYAQFVQEMHYIIDKDVLAQAGIKNVGRDTYAVIEAMSISKDPSMGKEYIGAESDLSPLVEYMEKRAEKHGDTYTGSGVEIALQIRNNRIEDLGSEDVLQLLMHTGANRWQAVYNGHGGNEIYDRSWADIEARRAKEAEAEARKSAEKNAAKSKSRGDEADRVLGTGAGNEDGYDEFGNKEI